MTIQTITLAQLLPPKFNPRKGMDAAALEGLAASIKADGLLQNLVVRKKGKKFEIVSGERRFRALALLAERGDIEKSHPIPVDVKSGLSADDALRLATVENIQREALAPLDEADAFAAMLAGGASFEDVAVKAGVSVLAVKRRLALASLCDEAKAQVRAGEMSLGCAEALTLGTTDQQRAVLERLAEDHWEPEPETIRDMLAGEKPSMADALFPIEAYSGSVTADLFADAAETLFDDVEQFHRLQEEAVAALAAKHAAAGSWVEVIRAPHAQWWQFKDAEDGEAAGVVIHVMPTGRVEVRESLAKRPVRPDVAEATRAPAKPKAQAEYAAPVMRNVSAHKSLAVMAALLDNPRKAREVAVAQMLNAADWAGRVKVEPHPALAQFEGIEAPATFQRIENACLPFGSHFHETEKGYGRATRGDWEWLPTQPKDAVQTYAAVKALDDADLERLHLLLTTLAFGQGTLDRLDRGASLFNAVAQDLGIDMRRHWRPDAAFLSKRRRSQLADIAKESGATARLAALKDYPKGKLVEALVKHFERTKDVADDAPDYDVKGRDWLPGAMLFPAVTSDPVEPSAPAEEPEAPSDGLVENEESALDEEPALEEAA
jgi:ParB family transcriptional regulator, chromosome partitioning protein